MLRLLLTSLLMILSGGPVYAEWVEVVSSRGNGGYTVYANTDFIRRTGDVVKWWEMFDYKTVQTSKGISRLSTKILSEYDCGEGRFRMLTLTHFTGNMGSGEMAFTGSGESKWEPVEPDSVGETMWKLVCSKP
jgi:hypothetical protein